MPGTTARPAVVDATGAQTMQGFGASGAWWPNDIVHFSPDVQDRVADMLFGPDGLALSVYRYNIGGGGVGVTVPARAAETFFVSPGSYDWSRDAGGRLFLRKAASMQVPILIGFVNSAPALWTTNGRCCGGSLAAGAEADYARYLADVVAYLHDAEGTTLSYVSPMNEPDSSFATCNQEGMKVPVTRRAALVRAVAAQLAQRAPFAQVIADESSRVLVQFLPEAPIWLRVNGGAASVAAVAHHLYDFPSDAALQAVRLEAMVVGKPFWMTEICCFDSRTGKYGQQYEPTMAGAMPLANLVWRSLTRAGDAAFHWWVALSSEMGCDPNADPEAAARPNDRGWNDGLIYYDPRYSDNGNQNLYPSKRYWVLGNFSRYVRPGDVRHEVSGLPAALRVLAFRSDRGWAVVCINNTALGADAAEVSIQLPADPSITLAADAALETSETRNLEPAALPTLDADRLLSATLPAQSVTTLVVAATPVG
jgi:O-glycosyl hydrolase